MRRLLTALALCLLPSCAMLTGPIDRMVARQELSLSEWEARQVEAQTDASLTADERVAAQKAAWADYRAESTANLSQGFGELTDAIDVIGSAGAQALVSGAATGGLSLMEMILGAVTGLTGAAGMAYGVKRSAAAQVNKERDARRTVRGEPV